MSERIGVLFVCMGNICRSPMAEAMFRHVASQRGVLEHFEIDSAGTGGWHAGESPDSRMRAVASRRGVPLSGGARQIVPRDLQRFAYIVCMDSENFQGVLRLGTTEADVCLMLDHHPDARCTDVPDPYYGGREGFDHVFELLETACSHLLDTLVDGHDLES